MKFLKKDLKELLKNNRSPEAWENLELRLQLQGKHGSGALQLRVPADCIGSCEVFSENL